MFLDAVLVNRFPLKDYRKCTLERPSLFLGRTLSRIEESSTFFIVAQFYQSLKVRLDSSNVHSNIFNLKVLVSFLERLID